MQADVMCTKSPSFSGVLKTGKKKEEGSDFPWARGAISFRLICTRCGDIPDATRTDTDEHGLTQTVQTDGDRLHSELDKRIGGV